MKKWIGLLLAVCLVFTSADFTVFAQVNEIPMDEQGEAHIGQDAAEMAEPGEMAVSAGEEVQVTDGLPGMELPEVSAEPRDSEKDARGNSSVAESPDMTDSSCVGESSDATERSDAEESPSVEESKEIVEASDITEIPDPAEAADSADTTEGIGGTESAEEANKSEDANAIPVAGADLQGESTAEEHEMSVSAQSFFAEGEAGSLPASGERDGIVWEIDQDGKLTVSGSGASVQGLWDDYKESIVSAEVKVQGLTDASHMFEGCKKLEKIDFSGFQTENITNMSGMFKGCVGLSKLDLSNFNTGAVTDMSYMFYGCRMDSLDLRSFNTANVTNMEYMFSLYGKAGSYDDSYSVVDFSNFNTCAVTNMSYMFFDCKMNSLDLSSFNTSSVTTMEQMFSWCLCLKNLNVSSFDTSNVVSMREMFYACGDSDAPMETLDLSSFRTGSVTDMYWMFGSCKIKNLDLSSFDFSAVIDMSQMFSGCKDLKSLNMGNTKLVQANMFHMFDGCTGLETLDLSGLDLSGVMNMTYMFTGCTRLKDVKLFRSANDGSYFWGCWLSEMFAGCRSLTDVDLSNFYFGDVGQADKMFRGCSSLTRVNFGNADAGKLFQMQSMFEGCSSLVDLDLSSFNCSLSLIDSMDGAFAGCSSLAYLDLSGFDTSSVKKFDRTLDGCGSLETIKAPAVMGSAKMALPGTFYDENGKAYSDLSAACAGKLLKDVKSNLENGYMIRFHSNGATAGKTVAMQCSLGKQYTLPACGYKNKGYSFTGWNTAQDGSGKAYGNKAKIKDLAQEAGTKVVLYAQWKLVKYKITYKLNGGKNDRANPVTYSIFDEFTLEDPTRKGYSFAGWFTDPKFKNEITSIDEGTAGKKTFYAKWVINKYSIVFDGNGATSGSMPDMKNIRDGKKYTLKANKFKRTGYTFTGWNTEADGSGQKCKNKDSITIKGLYNGDSIVLYAQWKKK